MFSKLFLGMGPLWITEVISDIAMNKAGTSQEDW